MKRTMPLLTVLTLSLISSPAQSAPTLLQKAKATAAKTVKVGSHAFELLTGFLILAGDAALFRLDNGMKGALKNGDAPAVGICSFIGSAGLNTIYNGYAGLKREIAPKSSPLQTIKKLFARLMHKAKNHK